MTHDTSPAQVAILLCTANGERFLPEQLDSIAGQDFPHWTLWVSDDGSTDGTLALLERYRAKWEQGRLLLFPGPRRGFAANFLSLACRPEVEARYYAFCDHDDIWEPDKLARALAWLKTVPEDIPALYCGRTRLIDEMGRECGFSPLFSRPPAFKNALVQSIAGGNTMVFNHAARELLRLAGKDVDVVTHDWWLYLLVSGCGGRVFYDPVPKVCYRQHGRNLVGSNIGWSARLIRLRMLFRGRLLEWTSRNLRALEGMNRHLIPENRAVLLRFAEIRSRPLAQRLAGLRRLGLYRQTLAGDIGLLVASLFRRL